MRVAALAVGAAASRIVYAEETINPSVRELPPILSFEVAGSPPSIQSTPEAKEVVIAGGRIAGVDNADDFQSGPETKVVDLRGRRVIPGLYDRTCTSFAAD